MIEEDKKKSNVRKQRRVFVVGAGDGDTELSDELLEEEYGDIGERIRMIVDCCGKRENTVMTRLSDEDIARIDSFLELDLFSSRSEAVAYFVHEGILARQDFIEGIDPLVEEIRELKEKARGTLTRKD
jgi:hypothetical protein